LRERKTRLRWLASFAIAPLFAVAAFGIAPQTKTEQVLVRNVIESLPLPYISESI
jgi:hypothetical protein